MRIPTLDWKEIVGMGLSRLRARAGYESEVVSAILCLYRTDIKMNRISVSIPCEVDGLEEGTVFRSFLQQKQ